MVIYLSPIVFYSHKKINEKKKKNPSLVLKPLAKKQS